MLVRILESADRTLGLYWLMINMDRRHWWRGHLSEYFRLASAPCYVRINAGQALEMAMLKGSLDDEDALLSIKGPQQGETLSFAVMCARRSRRSSPSRSASTAFYDPFSTFFFIAFYPANRLSIWLTRAQRIGGLDHGSECAMRPGAYLSC